MFTSLRCLQVANFIMEKQLAYLSSSILGPVLYNFYGCNLQIFVISQSVSGKPFQLSLMFVGKAGEYPSEAPFYRKGSGLTRKHQTWLERLARDKHSSLLRKSVNYDRKWFYSTSPQCHLYVTLWKTLAQTTLCSMVITTEKVFTTQNYSIIMA